MSYDKRILENWIFKHNILGFNNYWEIDNDELVGVDYHKLKEDIEKCNGKFIIDFPPTRVINMQRFGNSVKDLLRGNKVSKDIKIPHGTEVVILTMHRIDKLILPDTITAVRGSNRIEDVEYSGKIERIVDSGIALVNYCEKRSNCDERFLETKSDDILLRIFDVPLRIFGTVTETTETYNMSDDIKIIGDRCFEKLRLPDVYTDDVSEIRYYSFANTKINHIHFGKSLRIIDYKAFYNSSIKSLKFEPGIKAILSFAFQGCSELEEVVLPETLEYLDIDAFYECDNLRRLVIPKHTKIVRGTKYRMLYGMDPFDYLENCAILHNWNEMYHTKNYNWVKVETY